MKINSILATGFILIIGFSSCLTLDQPMITSVSEPNRHFDFQGDIAPIVDSCYDLSIKSIKILEKRKNDIIVEYTIENNGTATISIDGKTRSKNDNVGIQVFFSGDDKYNRGDLLVDGFFIQKPKKQSALIPPKSIYKAQLKISTKRKTSYHSSLIFHIDPMQVFKECDETNNYTSVKF